MKKYLKDSGAWFIKYWGGGQFTRSGIPDILCCVHGNFVALELKAQNGSPSELQLHVINEIRKSGGFAFVLYPSGFNKFKEFIENLKNDYFYEMEVEMK